MPICWHGSTPNPTQIQKVQSDTMKTTGIKIWFDIITPKDVLFFEPMIKKLSEKNNNTIMSTTRNYREAVGLARVRNMKIKSVGRHGGTSLIEKLRASSDRVSKLTNVIDKFGPDLAISFCSPEASRVAFGLGIKHVAFSNVVHYAAMMRLSIPLLDRLLVPAHIPKKRFAKFGISASNITQYNAMDEAVIVRNSSQNPQKPRLELKKQKTILFRPYENQAAYASGVTFDTIKAIKALTEELTEYNVIVLGRYTEQIKSIKRDLGKKAIILDKVIDSESIFSIADVFVGSGGTMTSEAALRGLPTISYEGIPNADEKHLVRMGLVKRCRDPEVIPRAVLKAMTEDSKKRNIKVNKFLNAMEDPYKALLNTIRSL